MNTSKKLNPAHDHIGGIKISFGTSGWRDIIADSFTAENVAIVTQAIANYLKKAHPDTKSGIIVGYDTRFMSDRFAVIACNILKDNNIPVLLTNRDTPTPVIAFHILKKHTLGAMNITASHNPPEYNGIKFSTSYGGPAPSEVTQEVEKEIHKLQEENKYLPYETEKEKINTFDPRSEYVEHMSKLIDLDSIKKSKIKIAIDCLHGTVRGYLDYILKKKGINAIVLHDSLNPLFDGASPSPSKENLAELRKTVIKNRLRIGLATDGDADRFGILDKDGSFMPANYILVLVLDHLLKTRKHKGGIVRSITTTHLLDAIAKKYNREVYEVPVGFKYVGTELKEKNAIMGCEESGGMTISGHVPEKDGILACLLMTEIAAHNKKSFKQLLNDLEKEYGKYYSSRIDVSLKQEDKESLLSNLKNNPLNQPLRAGAGLKEFAGIKVSNYEILPADNFKIDLADGSWVMIRPSGTEPIIRCYMETCRAKNLPLLENAIRGLFFK